MRLPFLSIITVCYNSVKTLEDTFRSVERLDYPNLELIVVDGGSNDGTLDIIGQYNYLISKQVSEPDNGVYDAMNKGINLLSLECDFVLFLGSDDLLLPQMFDNAELLSNKNEVYYGDVIFKSTNKVYDGHFNKWKLAQKNICHQAIFYPAKILRNRRFNEKYSLWADWEMNLQLYRETKFNYIPYTISIYNDQGLSSQSFDYKFLHDLEKLLVDNLGFFVGNIGYMLYRIKKKVRILTERFDF